MESVDKEIAHKGEITFGNAIKMYNSIISVGVSKFNDYIFVAENSDTGLVIDGRLGIGNQFVKGYDKERREEFVDKCKNEIAFLEDHLYNSVLYLYQQNAILETISNAPWDIAEGAKRWELENISGKSIEEMHARKRAKGTPFLLGGFFRNPVLSLVEDREIKISRKDDVYSVNFSAGSEGSLKRMERLFYNSISG